MAGKYSLRARKETRSGTKNEYTGHFVDTSYCDLWHRTLRGIELSRLHILTVTHIVTSLNKYRPWGVEAFARMIMSL